MLEDPSQCTLSSRAQKTSVPCSDKPAGVRDSVRGPGWWRGCRLFMEAPWIPQKSSSLMKDSLSMTVPGPLVIDLSLRTTTDSSVALGILSHFLASPFMTVGCETKVLFSFMFPLSTFGFFWASYHGSTPPEARLDHGHCYFRKAMTEFIPTLPAWPSTFSGTSVQNSSAHMALDVFSTFGGVGIKWKSYYSYFLVLLGMLSVFKSLLVFDPRIQTLNFTRIGCERCPQCECREEQHTLRCLQWLMGSIPSTISSPCSGERQSMVCFLHLLVQIVTTSTEQFSSVTLIHHNISVGWRMAGNKMSPGI